MKRKQGKPRAFDPRYISVEGLKLIPKKIKPQLSKLEQALLRK